MTGMEEPQERKSLLFVNANQANFPSRRSNRNSIDSEVRRHVMRDIGKARRKPSKDPHFVTLTWQTQKHTGKQQNPKRRHYGHLKTPEEYQVTISTPTLYALAVFEREWGEDSFSAYGFTLIMTTGKNVMSGTYLTNAFWSPFAFRKSAFLKHYQQIFSSPDLLVQLYRQSSLELKSIALERSLITIQCIESRLTSSDPSWATSDSGISAVLALICYNLSNLDFDQAMVHIRGIWMVIEARGGISTVENNLDLFLMISWVDITAALLHSTKPSFPLPMNMGALVRPGLKTLPDPLSGLLNGNLLHDERFLAILACMGDLNALATFLQTEQVTKGDAIWSDEEQMALLLNPIAHDLLNQQQSEPLQLETPFEIIFESLRLGAIIWIIQVKRRCRSYPGTAQAHITTLLRTISKEGGANTPWNCSANLQVVRLWLLVLCSVSEPSGQDYSTLMRIIASEMKELNLSFGPLRLVSPFYYTFAITVAYKVIVATSVEAAEESTKASPPAHETQEGTTNADAPIEASSPNTIRDAMTPKPISAEPSDGDSDLEESSSVSLEEVVLNLEEKIRQLESQLRERSEASSVLTTPYASLKRKMQEELYDPISKKMKPASQVSLEMSSFSTEVAGRYMSVVHNEVFRMAGRSGLINPADFDVGSDGVVGLSKHALKKVYPDD
ncbi:hypothetical protein FPHYL_4783 [Fusarium phyllophilum]|uniref:Uncharacterized protein n=1 Tax=Fusarium phyllophilum TaxID=47803 RepID=A0A8H5JYL5_9HYPO|nr:hypothetical protein FPHYL_4783 [Fusarium phyllophilum]